MRNKYNIGILAHVDAGKTTITEQLLLVSGTIRKGGSVDEGTTRTDFLEVERKRGISVKNACISLTSGDNEIAIIDTPGHVDFSGEVSRSLSAMDGAVLLLSAVEGVQAQTLTLYGALRKMKLPTILVCNKIDRAGYEREEFLRKLREELTGNFAPLDDAEALFERLADLDPALEEMFLSEEKPDPSFLYGKLAEYTKKGEFHPLLFTSAKEGKGISELLQAITRFLPSAAEREEPVLSGTVFSLQHDDTMGKVAFLRLFGGSLSARDVLPVLRLAPSEYGKISQIRRISGGRYEDIGRMEAGDIAAVYGLTDIRIGDVIGAEPAGRMKDPLPAKPLLLTETAPSDPEKTEELAKALTELSEEDPLLEFERNILTGRMYLHIMGEIQTEILAEILRERFGLSAVFSRPRVIFKEKPLAPAEGFEAYTMPKPCWAIVTLRVEPLPPGSGIVFESVIKEGELSGRYQNHVEESVKKTVHQGIYGWEVMDTKVTLIAGNSHHIHTHPLDFFVATPVAFLRALQAAPSVLMEPVMKMTLTASEELLGKVLGHLIEMEGEAGNPVLKDGRFTLTAAVPLRKCMDYPQRFRSLTSGKGTVNMDLEGYRPCPSGVLETLPRNGVDPLDRAKWILACRSALGKDLTGR